MTKHFLTNGRSGPGIINRFVPKSPFHDNYASLAHDLCAHGIGLSKRECDCVYTLLLKSSSPGSAGMAGRVLDVLPTWFTNMDYLWFLNEPFMIVRSYWAQCTNPRDNCKRRTDF